MIPIAQLRTSDVDDRDALVDLSSEAQEFLQLHRWCLSIKSGYFDRGFSKVAVFYFEIDSVPPADGTVWVIVGDLPPAYIDTETCPNGAAALYGYVLAAREWVEAVDMGGDTSGLMPIVRRGSYALADPTPEMAKALKGRLDFIEEKLLPQWTEELNASPLRP